MTGICHNIRPCILSVFWKNVILCKVCVKSPVVIGNVTLVVWTARAGKARSVSAAASRPRGLERQFSLGVWREHTLTDICDTDCS